MDTNDTRQGAFSAAKFRQGIKFAMKMGLPGTESERVQFTWKPENTYAIQDHRSVPYDFTSSATSTVSAVDLPASLTVPVAVEFFDSKSASGETPIGDFDISRLKITILDDEYALIIDQNLGLPDGVTVDGNDYTVDYFAPPVGLFNVTVYTAYCSALDES